MAIDRARRRALVVGSVALMSLCRAHAAPDGVPAEVAKDVRAVVQAQLDAFAHDDGPRAFSYATPALRESFGSAERFMAMVRSGYPAVLRPSAVLFFDPEPAGEQLLQRVQMTDPRGVVWVALYQMELQPDKHWRIAGCFLKESRARVV